jgi:hypothetical protein
MHKPEKHQIIYISVPKRDHAMLEIGQESDERRPLLDRLAEQIQFIRERLFIK